MHRFHADEKLNFTKKRPTPAQIAQFSKSNEKHNGKQWILSHQGDEKRLEIAEEDDKIVEKQLAAAVGSCFSKATLLCIDCQKSAKQRRSLACSCF